MSKFRTKNRNNKIDVCGKTPVGLLGHSILGLEDVFGYDSKAQLRLTSVYQEFFDAIARFRNEAVYGGSVSKGKEFFIALTKSDEPKVASVDSDSRCGIVISIGILRGLLKDGLPMMLKERYTHHYRGDHRKRESKSMDWVKPDFKNFTALHGALDVINFVKESPCDVVECSANHMVWRNYNTRSSYRRREMTFKTISKRYENTNWFNTARKCYYENFKSSGAWEKTKPERLKQYGMEYDVIMSELIMTYS